MKIVALIQARMGSTRLPGKILMDISGKPMLWHIVNRLRKSKLAGRIVVATSTSKKDDVVEKFCKDNKIDFYRGSENDVLDRYYNAARAYEADAVVRITGDCPLIDPNIVDETVSAYLNENNLDMVSNVIKRCYPRGLDTEVISFKTLEKVWKGAPQCRHREHVTIYIYENMKKFKVRSVENKTDLSYLHWTVDEKKDLEMVKEIYKRLYKEGSIFTTDDILKVLEKEPELKVINMDVK